MTEQVHPIPPASPARRPPSLYRTVLSVAIAAFVAAWLPFSLLYIDALSKRASAVPTVVHVTSTTASGHSVTAVTPLTTRTS